MADLSRNILFRNFGWKLRSLALAIVIWIIYRGYVRGNLWLTAPVSAPMFASLYSESMPAHPQIWWLIPLPIVAAMILNGTEKNKVGISR